MVEDAEGVIASAQPMLLRASMRKLSDQALIARGFKTAMITALTAEAELYHLAPPAHAESRQLCLSAVMKIVGLAKTFKTTDYGMVDPFHAVSVLLLDPIYISFCARPKDGMWS